MQKVISSDQFVAGVMAALALQNRSEFQLDSTDIDERFEKAFEKLVAASEALDVVPSFSFRRDNSHGDSDTLRDTLHSANERKIIALNNSTFWTFEIKLSKERATRYLEKNPIPRTFYDDVVRIFDT